MRANISTRTVHVSLYKNLTHYSCLMEMPTHPVPRLVDENQFDTTNIQLYTPDGVKSSLYTGEHKPGWVKGKCTSTIHMLNSKYGCPTSSTCTTSLLHVIKHPLQNNVRPTRTKRRTFNRTIYIVCGRK